MVLSDASGVGVAGPACIPPWKVSDQGTPFGVKWTDLQHAYLVQSWDVASGTLHIIPVFKTGATKKSIGDMTLTKIKNNAFP